PIETSKPDGKVWRATAAWASFGRIGEKTLCGLLRETSLEGGRPGARLSQPLRAELQCASASSEALAKFLTAAAETAALRDRPFLIAPTRRVSGCGASWVLLFFLD